MKKSSTIRKISLEKTKVVLLKAPYEKTVSGRLGTFKGPQAISKMLSYQVEEWDCLLKRNTGREVEIIEKDVSVSKLKPEEAIAKVKQNTFFILSRGKFPVILGGEHSVSLGAVLAAREIFGNLTVVQIDAHADLRDDNSDYEEKRGKISKYSHGCVMRRIYEAGCGIVQVGIRSMSPEEYNFIIEHKLEKNIFYAPIKKSFKEIISRCLTDKVYLTIDVDGFDPSVMPATGTPEPGGISWEWGLQFFEKLFSQKEIVGFDIVEVAPRKGDSRTEFAAAKLLYHLIGLKYFGRHRIRREEN
jgi:agmatinase